MTTSKRVKSLSCLSRVLHRYFTKKVDKYLPYDTFTAESLLFVSKDLSEEEPFTVVCGA